MPLPFIPDSREGLSCEKLSDFFQQSHTVLAVLLDRRSFILDCNLAFEQFCGDKSKLLLSEFTKFLAADEAQEFTAYLKDLPTEPVIFTFVVGDEIRMSIRATLSLRADGILLIAEPLLSEHIAYEQRIGELNDRFTVLLRENDRKQRALDRANAELSRALEELQQSHWHLRKIADVLPICMSCKRIKADSDGWREIADYLNENCEFLSHGYCPQCAHKALAVSKSH